MEIPINPNCRIQKQIEPKPCKFFVSAAEAEQMYRNPVNISKSLQVFSSCCRKQSRKCGNVTWEEGCVLRATGKSYVSTECVCRWSEALLAADADIGSRRHIHHDDAAAGVTSASRRHVTWPRRWCDFQSNERWFPPRVRVRVSVCLSVMMRDYCADGHRSGWRHDVRVVSHIWLQLQLASDYHYRSTQLRLKKKQTD